MSESIVGRGKSGVLVAAGSSLLACLLMLICAAVPRDNMVVALVGAGLFFGSPFVWLLILLKGVFWQDDVLLSLAILAPYPVLGAIAGCLWPLTTSTLAGAIRQIAYRFVAIVCACLALGIGLALFAAAHDS